MTIHFPDLARAVAADGEIAPQEILALRRLGWGCTPARALRLCHAAQRPLAQSTILPPVRRKR